MWVPWSMRICLLCVCVCVFETEPCSPFHNPISPNVSQCLVCASCLVEHLQKKDPKTKANAPDETWILATWWFLCVPCPEVEDSAYKADFSKSKGRQSCTGLLCPKSSPSKQILQSFNLEDFQESACWGGAFWLKCRFWAMFGWWSCPRRATLDLCRVCGSTALRCGDLWPSSRCCALFSRTLSFTKY